MVEKLMKNLGISREEALQVIADDKAIDKGEKLFELSAEQKKAAKQATRADNKPRSTPTKREPKVDKDKAEIMQTIDDALCCLVDDVQERTNDRELVFIYNEKKYKITLSCPRS
jgi:hypothetical protein